MAHYKLQVELTEAQRTMLAHLQAAGELRTTKELLDNAFTLLKWAVKQRQDGRLIVSLDPQTKEGRELELPYLTKVEEVAKVGRDPIGVPVAVGQ